MNPFLSEISLFLVRLYEEAMNALFFEERHVFILCSDEVRRNWFIITLQLQHPSFIFVFFSDYTFDFFSEFQRYGEKISNRKN